VLIAGFKTEPLRRQELAAAAGRRQKRIFTRKVPRIDPTVVRFSPRSAKRKTNTHAGSIGAALLERAKELG